MALIKQHHQRVFASFCFFIMLAALFIGGHQPVSGTLFPPPWDKLVHFIFYGALTIFAAFTFPKIPLPLLGLIVIGIGGADEIHQIFVPGRSPGLDDLAADITGCLPALYIILWLRAKYEK
jgi:VanZ family protein